MKIHLYAGFFLLVTLCGGMAAAEPIGPGAGTSSDQTSCDRCAACRKTIAPTGQSSPIQDETNNSQRAAQCKADCADCEIRGAAPASVPANAVDQTKAKQ
jgi:hypothetical protein